MKIAQFSTNDINGGAAVASYRLFSGLQKLVDVKYFVKNKTLNDENIITDFIEKPESFVSDLAIIGIYYFKDGTNLKQELKQLRKKQQNYGRSRLRLQELIKEI